MRRLLLTAFAAVFLAACGQRFELPPETGGEILDPGYIVTRVWTGVPEPTDLGLVEGVLFAAEESTRVVSYSTASPEGTPIRNPLVADFQNAGRPVLISGTRSGSTIYLAVADAESLQVKRYLFTGGDSLMAFRDPDWGAFAGICLDTDLTTYVAYLKRDGTGYIRHYAADGTRISTVSEDGTGRGFVQTPTSLYLSAGFLFCTSSGNNWRVQKLDPMGLNTGLMEFPKLDDSMQLSTPRDVVVDRAGFIYVADTGRARVLKYSSTGAFADSVYTTLMSEARVGAGLKASPLLAPSALIGLEEIVYVGDPETNRIVRFEVNK
jgi:sugar lactone lactonase YvrE